MRDRVKLSIERGGLFCHECSERSSAASDGAQRVGLLSQERDMLLFRFFQNVVSEIRCFFLNLLQLSHLRGVEALVARDRSESGVLEKLPAEIARKREAREALRAGGNELSAVCGCEFAFRDSLLVLSDSCRDVLLHVRSVEELSQHAGSIEFGESEGEWW